MSVYLDVYDFSTDARLLLALQSLCDALEDAGALVGTAGSIPQAVLHAQYALAANCGDAVLLPDHMPLQSWSGDAAMLQALETLVSYAVDISDAWAAIDDAAQILALHGVEVGLSAPAPAMAA